MNDRELLERFALDWHNLAGDLLKDVEAEMDRAHEADDASRYRWAGLLAGKIKTARHVMLASISLGGTTAGTSGPTK